MATAKLDSDELMCVTKVKVKAQSSGQGVKAGLVLLSESDPASLGEERLKVFDDWTRESYKEAEKRYVCACAHFFFDKSLVLPWCSFRPQRGG